MQYRVGIGMNTESVRGHVLQLGSSSDCGHCRQSETSVGPNGDPLGGDAMYNTYIVHL